MSLLMTYERNVSEHSLIPFHFPLPIFVPSRFIISFTNNLMFSNLWWWELTNNRKMLAYGLDFQEQITGFSYNPPFSLLWHDGDDSVSLLNTTLPQFFNFSGEPENENGIIYVMMMSTTRCNIIQEKDEDWGPWMVKRVILVWSIRLITCNKWR